jgi:hypothetical protein
MMTALEIELWLACAVTTAMILAIVAAWGYEAVASCKRTGCRPDCPRLPGGCIGRIGGKCAARKGQT